MRWIIGGNMTINAFALALSEGRYTAKLPPGDPRWRDFNGSFRNTTVEPSQLMDAIYYGHAMTTQHRNGWRSAENYYQGQHIGLDFDSEDKNSTIAHLEADKFVRQYASIIHTTMSHQPDKPRARVVFLLDTPIMQAKNYSLAATALLWLFGTADRQCKDAVRFFYGSPGCEFSFINEVLPLDKVKRIIADYQATGMAERKRATNKNFSAPATQQEAHEALKLIPPWGVSYDEWVSILMAIHAAFGEDGYPLAESWADGKPREVERKWSSFKQSGNTSGAVTVATLFGIAKRFGWRRAEVGQ